MGAKSLVCINTNMDYKRIYDELIVYRKQNPIIHKSQYSENHHIIPTALGGSEDKENKVRLTGREHYLAHLLLARFWRCSENANALWMMQMKNTEESDRPCIKSGRMYEWSRKEFAKYQSGRGKLLTGNKNPAFGKNWICNLELKENKMVPKTDVLPEGWILGRDIWNHPIKKIKIKKIKKTTIKRDKRKNALYLTDGVNTKRLIYLDEEIPKGWYSSLLELHFLEVNKLVNAGIPLYKACKAVGISFNTQTYKSYNTLLATIAQRQSANLVS